MSIVRCTTDWADMLTHQSKNDDKAHKLDCGSKYGHLKIYEAVHHGLKTDDQGTATVLRRRQDVKAFLTKVLDNE